MSPAEEPLEPNDLADADVVALGLAADFAAYVRRNRIPRDQHRQALAAWLDELIAREQCPADSTE
jgi:hypothetical protein